MRGYYRILLGNGDQSFPWKSIWKSKIPSRELWAMVLGLFGVYWVMPKTFVDLLASWSGCFRRYWNGLLWMAAPHCLMWCIQRERDNRSFEDTERTMPDLKLFFLRILLDQVSVIHSHSLCSVIDLLDSCNLHE